MISSFRSAAVVAAAAQVEGVPVPISFSPVPEPPDELHPLTFCSLAVVVVVVVGGGGGQ